MTSVVHLKTSTRFQEGTIDGESIKLEEIFVDACLQLDASLFEPFMEEEDMFEDKEKYLFLESLRNIFLKARQLAGKDFRVEKVDGKCLGCSLGKPIVRFNVYGSNSLTFDFGFVISYLNGCLADIYQCQLYKEKEGQWTKPEGMPEIFLDYGKGG